MSEGLTVQKIGIGIFLIITVTTPLWLPYLLGLRIKECEIGMTIDGNKLIPYYKCQYQKK